MEAENEKIILKTEFMEGGDKSLYDFGLLSSVKVNVTQIVVPIHKSGTIAYIGTKEPLLPQEVIKVKRSGISYKIIGSLVKVIPTGGYIYRVKRTDGYNITQLDINSTIKGEKLFIKNRKTFEQLINR